MKVITIANQKGGVGKSTLCTNLAALFAADGRKVLLLDTDPQASSIAFREKRAETGNGLPEFSAAQIQSPTVHKDIASFAGFDVILVDTGGRDNKIFRSAVLPADLVLVPLCPSQYDFWGSADTFDALKEIRLSRPELHVLACFNMVIPNTRIAQEVLSAKAEFEAGYEVRFMDTHLCGRVAYKYSAGDGRAVSEAEGRSRDPQAISEMKAFYRELKGALNGGTAPQK